MTDFERHNAIITDNNDPEKSGRIKAKCPSLLDEEQDLPFWIPPKFTYVDGAGGHWFAVPANGSWVEILVPVESRWDEVPFEQSLQMEGAGIRWQCETFNDLQKVHKYFKKNYPQRYGCVWPNGWIQYIDAADGEMTLAYAPDEGGDPEAWIRITKDKAIELETSDGMKIHILSSKILIEAGAGPVEVVAPNIKLGGAAAIEPLVLGTALMTYLSTVQAAFGSVHTHLITMPGNPSGPPDVIMPVVPPTILSTKHTTE